MVRSFIPLVLLTAALVWAEEPPKDSPKVDVSKVPVETILTEDTSASRVGTFGLRLEEYGMVAYLHGYAMGALSAQTRGLTTFELGEFHVYAGADIRGRVRPEILVMLANGIEETGSGGLTLGSIPEVGYAQIDVAILDERLVARAGYFLVPMGSFNRALFPSYLNKLPRAPSMFGEVLPRHWSEVGLEVHGRFDLQHGRALHYAAYVANGLEQSGMAEGGDVGEMRGHLVDEYNPDKAVGLRLGVDPIENLSIAASAYTGAYTAAGNRRLTILNADVGARVGAFTLRAEGAIALQEVTAGVRRKTGLYGYAAWRVHPFVEPVVGGEVLADERSWQRGRVWAGGVVYPMPDLVPTLVGKAFGGLSWRADRGLDPELHVQLAVGF